MTNLTMHSDVQLVQPFPLLDLYHNNKGEQYFVHSGFECTEVDVTTRWTVSGSSVEVRPVIYVFDERHVVNLVYRIKQHAFHSAEEALDYHRKLVYDIKHGHVNLSTKELVDTWQLHLPTAEDEDESA